MAKMVTRTLKVTEAEVLVIDIANEKTEVVPMSFAKVFKNENQILKAAQKMLGEPDTVKAVSVKGFNVTEHRYGMPEEVFMEQATEIEPLKK